MNDFFIVSIPSPLVLGDNSVQLVVTSTKGLTVLQYPGPNGKLDADIAFRKLWAEEVNQ